MRHWCHYLEGSRNPVQVLSDHENLKIFISTKALNCHQARWAELLANYDFVLIPVPGTKNPADGPSHRPDYTQDIPVPTGSLIPPNALRLLPSNFTTNALFASIVGVHTVEAVEPALQE